MPGATQCGAIQHRALRQLMAHLQSDVQTRLYCAAVQRDEMSLFSTEATRGIELRAIHLPAARLIDI